MNRLLALSPNIRTLKKTRRLLRQPERVLLRARIKDLGLRIEGTWLEECVEQLLKELQDRGLLMRPLVYLGDEWFSPSGENAIAIPFYLAHPRLMRLEERLMNDVEGRTKAHCMRLLRHEAGHCFNHAFGFSTRPRWNKQWRKLFGDPRRAYRPEHYSFDPDSKDYVIHLEDHYAQSHPDEDFAETFAVWLNPKSNWRKKYARWKGAREKLQFIEELVSEVAGFSIAPATTRDVISDAKQLESTLLRYYSRRKAEKKRNGIFAKNRF
jgi:hypothetical protein